GDPGGAGAVPGPDLSEAAGRGRPAGARCHRLPRGEPYRADPLGGRRGLPDRPRRPLIRDCHLARPKKWLDSRPRIRIMRSPGTSMRSGRPVHELMLTPDGGPEARAGLVLLVS